MTTTGPASAGRPLPSPGSRLYDNGRNVSLGLVGRLRGCPSVKPQLWSWVEGAQGGQGRARPSPGPWGESLPSNGAGEAWRTNGLLGPGLSYSINKRNAFRGAETLTLGVNGSYEWQTGANMQGDNTGINSWELGGNLNLTYPRFIFFGNLWRKLNRRIQASTLFKMDIKWMNRAGYYGSASAGARIKWTFKKGENIIHEFTSVRLEYNHLLSTTQRFDDLMKENPALYESLRDKLVPSMEYAFTWTSPKVQKHQGRVSLFTKQALQFQKYTAEYSHMLRVSPRSQLVVRGYLGFIWNYGDQTAPYADLFSAGGANSIRAFGVRGIGPGSYNPAESSYSYLDQVGNIRFECNVEYRFPIVANLFGAVFLDAGNVWLTKEDPARPGGQFQPTPRKHGFLLTREALS